MKIDVEDIKKRMAEIPFGSSIFQSENFFRKEGVERGYRHALLQIDKWLFGLQESYFRRQEIELEIENAESELEKSRKWYRRIFYSKHKLKLKELDVVRKKFRLDHETKVIKDAEIELQTYYGMIKDMPVITRQEFEQAEGKYWIDRLTNDAKNEYLITGAAEKGTMQSLNQIGVNFYRDQKTGLLSWNIPEDKKLEQEPKLKLEETTIFGGKP